MKTKVKYIPNRKIRLKINRIWSEVQDTIHLDKKINSSFVTEKLQNHIGIRVELYVGRLIKAEAREITKKV